MIYVYLMYVSYGLRTYTQSMSQVVLKTVVFMGSGKTLVAPWGGDARVGDRVLNHVKTFLQNRNGKLGESTTVTHDVTVLDPIEAFGEGGALAASGAQISSPHFYYKGGDAPPAMDAMRDVIKAADCYLIVTAEYNHSLPPGLTGLMGHFGGSNYAGKCSGVVTYSPSPWAGMRAQMAAKPFLAELGCLPVSALCGFPGVSDLFNEDGTPKDPANRMLKQLPKMVSQMEWNAVAMKNMRDANGLPTGE